MTLRYQYSINRSGHQYGRRIENDRSWTVYHVFTGTPADEGTGPTTGLNIADAADRMAILNSCANRDSMDAIPNLKPHYQ